ncbi:MAG: hypothetical protein IBX56_02500 [Methylomicrobium sp.]|nr:hypothetical protein [Methylomicrobium sp.]
MSTLSSRFSSGSPVIRVDYPLTDDALRLSVPSIFFRHRAWLAFGPLCLHPDDSREGFAEASADNGLFAFG